MQGDMTTQLPLRRLTIVKFRGSLENVFLSAFLVIISNGTRAAGTLSAPCQFMWSICTLRPGLALDSQEPDRRSRIPASELGAVHGPCVPPSVARLLALKL